MAASIAQKLKIKEGFSLLTINAPANLAKDLAPLPADTKLSSTATTYQQIHWFVKDKTEMHAEVEKVIGLLKADVICWIYYPKGTSKIQTDLTRDKGWESLLKRDELHWISLISFNETWSAFGMRLKTAADKKKEAKPKTRPIFDYIDATKKLVYPPDDFAAALVKNNTEADFFDSLSFSNKKEYLEWIVTARRPETRATRINESIERLSKGWRNPAKR